MGDARETRRPRHGPYYAVAALLGVVANTVLASPLCPLSSRLISALSPACVAAMVIASLVAARVVRSLVLGRTKASLFAAGMLHAFVSSIVFVPLLLSLVSLQKGELPKVEGLLLYPLYGPLYCALTGYVTLPLGIAGAWVMRRLWLRSAAREEGRLEAPALRVGRVRAVRMR